MGNSIEVPFTFDMYQVAYLVSKGWTYCYLGKYWTKPGFKYIPWVGGEETEFSTEGAYEAQMNSETST